MAVLTCQLQAQQRRSSWPQTNSKPTRAGYQHNRAALLSIVSHWLWWLVVYHDHPWRRGRRADQGRYLQWTYTSTSPGCPHPLDFPTPGLRYIWSTALEKHCPPSSKVESGPTSLEGWIIFTCNLHRPFYPYRRSNRRLGTSLYLTHISLALENFVIENTKRHPPSRSTWVSTIILGRRRFQAPNTASIFKQGVNHYRHEQTL